jgi:hypothetical protein
MAEISASWPAVQIFPALDATLLAHLPAILRLGGTPATGEQQEAGTSVIVGCGGRSL